MLHVLLTAARSAPILADGAECTTRDGERLDHQSIFAMDVVRGCQLGAESRSFVLKVANRAARLRIVKLQLDH